MTSWYDSFQNMLSDMADLPPNFRGIAAFLEAFDEQMEFEEMQSNAIPAFDEQMESEQMRSNAIPPTSGRGGGGRGRGA